MMEEMVFICPECDWLADYDPYLKRVRCRSRDCSWSVGIYKQPGGEEPCFEWFSRLF